MKWFRFQVVILTLTLVADNARCLVTCASQPCHDSNVVSQSSSDELPPCHQRGSSQSKGAPLGCDHALFVAEALSIANTRIAQTVTAGFLPLPSVDTAFLARLSQVVVQDSSPPFREDLSFSIVLQI